MGTNSFPESKSSTSWASVNKIFLALGLATFLLTGCQSKGWWAAKRTHEPAWKTFNIYFPEAVNKTEKIELLKVKDEAHWAEGHETVALKDGGLINVSIFLDHDPNAAKEEDKKLYLYELTADYGLEKEESFYRAGGTRMMLTDNIDNKGNFFQLSIRLSDGHWSDMHFTENRVQPGNTKPF